jgi:hypothetical protein
MHKDRSLDISTHLPTLSQETIASFRLLHYCSDTRFVMCRRMLSCWRHVGDVTVDRHDKFSDLAGCDRLTAAFLRRSSLNSHRSGRGTSRTVFGHRVHNYHHYTPDFQTDAAAAMKQLYSIQHDHLLKICAWQRVAMCTPDSKLDSQATVTGTACMLAMMTALNNLITTSTHNNNNPSSHHRWTRHRD